MILNLLGFCEEQVENLNMKALNCLDQVASLSMNRDLGQPWPVGPTDISFKGHHGKGKGKGLGLEREISYHPYLPARLSEYENLRQKSLLEARRNQLLAEREARSQASTDRAQRLRELRDQRLRTAELAQIEKQIAEINQAAKAREEQRQRQGLRQGLLKGQGKGKGKATGKGNFKGLDELREWQQANQNKIKIKNKLKIKLFT